MENDNSLPGKRKKSVSKFPNPLFSFWLKEMRDDAASRGLKTQYCYSKALRSLSKYPLPLPDGKSCKILENFGDKICRELDNKLKEHVELYGAADFVPEEMAQSIPGYQKSVKPKRRNTSGVTGQPNQRHQSIGRDPDSENEDLNPSQGRPKKRNKSAGSREYLPKPGTGPYAILITLMRVSGADGSMSKKQLMKEAQPFCDSSFTVPDKPGCRYTAWSSMGHLIIKGLVIKRSSPAQYNLTPAGAELALRLLDLDNSGREQNQTGSSSLQAPQFTLSGSHTNHLPAPAPALPNLLAVSDLMMDVDQHRKPLHTLNDIKCDLEMPSPSSCQTPQKSSAVFPGRGHILGSSTKKPHELPPWRRPQQTPSPPVSELQDIEMSLPGPLYPENDDVIFQFSYCTDEGKLVTNKDQAAVTIEENLGGLGFLITCTYDELLMSGKLYKRDYTRCSSEADKVFAFLADKDAPDKCPSQTKPMTAQLIPSAVPCNVTADQIAPVPNKLKNAKPRPKTETVTTKTLHLPQPTMLSKPINQLQQDLVQTTTVTSDRYSAGRLQQGQGVGGKERSLWETVSSSASSSTTGSRASSQDTVDEDPPFTLHPGTFDVILCVDKREHFGGTNTSKQQLLPELQKHRTKFELRNLQIGDFAWVARPKNAPEGDREVVLDYVVERKRMDDLSSSVMGDRFSEQKFRLSQCGLPHVIYLVEDHGSNQNFGLGLDALNQNIVNTQIVDGFYIKHTRDMKESVAYLTLMTRYLENKYQTKHLIACSRRSREDVAIPDDPENLQCRLLTFSEFNEGATKRKAETIRELFMRQLVQIHRLTPEKAVAILELYPTPALLIAAFHRCQSTKEAENLLADIKFNATGSKFGTLLSKQVYMLYSKMNG